MKIISTEQLVEKLNGQESFKVVMTFHPRGYEAKHIPGSINIYSEESAVGKIKPEDEIVVYCINENCTASISAYYLLKSKGFKNILRYAGGLQAWESAGYELEGTDVSKMILPDNNFSL